MSWKFTKTTLLLFWNACYLGLLCVLYNLKAAVTLYQFLAFLSLVCHLSMHMRTFQCFESTLRGTLHFASASGCVVAAPGVKVTVPIFGCWWTQRPHLRHNDLWKLHYELCRFVLQLDESRVYVRLKAALLWWCRGDIAPAWFTAISTAIHVFCCFCIQR